METRISPQHVDAALWYRNLRETTNETFLPLLFDGHRYLVLVGGAGSGKSVFAGRFVLERVTCEPGHRWLVCRKVAKTLRESCFSQLVSQAADFYPDAIDQIQRGDLRLTFKNSSEILFAGLDDVEKLKSIYGVTGVWIEEASELQETDFNQLDIRLRGETPYVKQMILTFNPVSILHWLKKRFFDRRDERAVTHHSTYLDNRFLDEDAVCTLRAFERSDPYYHQVYCLGQWGVTGKSVFDAAAVGKRLSALPPPLKRGFFAYDDDGRALSNLRFVDDPDGFVRIYKLPEPGVAYVIGGDTAGDGSDFFVGQALDNRTGEQAAVLRHSFDEDVYARQLFCLGKYYNDALIGVECNFSSYPVRELTRLAYPCQYVRESFDSFTGRPKHSFGFVTNAKTRPVILAELIRVVREDVGLVNDETTLSEMLTFVRNEAFRPEAEAGAHDDCVMALAIAHAIRPQQRFFATPPRANGTAWSDDMWEDYQNADDAARKYLIEKWGSPF